MQIWLQIHIHVYSPDIMLTSEYKIGFRCADKYDNQEWSLKLRTARLNNVLHFCEILKTITTDVLEACFQL